MHNYKLIIAFAGTKYSGWQIQSNGTSVQGLLQNAIRILIKEDVKLSGSGRTDAGVHAKGQTAHFKCSSPIDIYRFFGSLNALLPDDISILEIVEVPLEFHSRYWAVSKTYHYHLHLAPVESPFNRLYSWHIREKFDIEKLKEAAKLLVGTHNFTSFANDSDSGCAGRNPIRTMHCIKVVTEGQSVRLEYTADGFLYKMVRNLTGTLVEIGKGRRPVEDIVLILALKDRSKAGISAPAQGLFLVNVEYPII